VTGKRDGQMTGYDAPVQGVGPVLHQLDEVLLDVVPDDLRRAQQDKLVRQ
jgi:hypothetical protein